MEKIKLLLYCTKQMPNLYINNCVLPSAYDRYFLDNSKNCYNAFGEKLETLNGKIVAECDFEVEEIKTYYNNQIYKGCRIHTINTYTISKLLELSCLSQKQLDDYLGENNGYAIHIKNLNIFDKPRELEEYTTRKPKTYDTMICDSCMATNIDCKQCSHNYEYQEVMKAPQNMMKVCEWDLKDYVLISIRPEWLCKILNGEKNIEVRKKVLKEMITDA